MRIKTRNMQRIIAGTHLVITSMSLDDIHEMRAKAQIETTVNDIIGRFEESFVTNTNMIDLFSATIWTVN